MKYTLLLLLLYKRYSVLLFLVYTYLNEALICKTCYIRVSICDNWLMIQFDLYYELYKNKKH